jgi:hypothetical protein
LVSWVSVKVCTTVFFTNHTFKSKMLFTSIAMMSHNCTFGRISIDHPAPRPDPYPLPREGFRGLVNAAAPSILRCNSICTQLLPSDAALPSSAHLLLPATPVVSQLVAKPSRFFSSRAFSFSKSCCEKIPLCRRFIACTQMAQLSDTLNGYPYHKLRAEPIT